MFQTTNQVYIHVCVWIPSNPIKSSENPFWSSMENHLQSHGKSLKSHWILVCLERDSLFLGPLGPIVIPNILGSIIPELIITQQGFWTPLIWISTGLWYVSRIPVRTGSRAAWFAEGIHRYYECVFDSHPVSNADVFAVINILQHAVILKIPFETYQELYWSVLSAHLKNTDQFGFCWMFHVCFS